MGLEAFDRSSVMVESSLLPRRSFTFATASGRRDGELAVRPGSHGMRGITQCTCLMAARSSCRISLKRVQTVPVHMRLADGPTGDRRSR
jgi:hypothetical protein